MIVYRICKSKYHKDLSGAGAEQFGGRWNSKGVPMLYTSESAALCMLEVLVHIPRTSIPDDFVMISLSVPDDNLEAVDESSLPKKWNDFPIIYGTTTIGDNFIRQRTALILKVPSSIVPESYNYLINPLHPDITKVKIEKVMKTPFDKRLF
ncbi:MAG TPA: RES family NAD+ phosphorylase [Ignavibacteria bacterium]|nr:RES family NAD+ phosphorylase [Ignavibacteria bacterium]